MGKFKRVIITGLFLCVMCMLSGCVTYKSEVNINKEGAGHISFSVYYDKNSIENSKFMLVNSPEDLERFFTDKIDTRTGIKIISDTSLKEKNELMFRLTFNSVEDLDNKVKVVRDVYDELFDMESEGFYIESGEYESESKNEVLTKALVQYMEENNIKIDTNHRNYRKFAKFINYAVYNYCDEDYEDEEYYEEYDECIDRIKNKCDFSDEDEYIVEELPNIIIESQPDDAVAKISSMAMNFMETYITSIVQLYGAELFNVTEIEEHSKSSNADIVYEVYYKTFQSIDLASYVKNALKEKFGNDINIYDMNDFSPVLSAKLFDDDFNKVLGKAYSDNYDIVYSEKQSEGNNYDIIDLIYGSKDVKYVLVFDGNILTLSLDEIYDLQDEDGYITINGENIKEGNNCNADGLDDTPFTNDNFDIIMLIIIKLIVVSIIFIIIKKRWRKEV